MPYKQWINPIFIGFLILFYLPIKLAALQQWLESALLFSIPIRLSFYTLILPPIAALCIIWNRSKILDICNIYKLHGLKYKKVKKHSADVFKTHGDNSKIKKNLKNIEFTDQILAIKKTFEWYKKYKIHKY